MCTTLLVLFLEVLKNCYCVVCGDFLGKISALEINIESMIPEYCQFFVNEINTGRFVKPSDLVYAISALAWDNGEL